MNRRFYGVGRSEYRVGLWEDGEGIIGTVDFTSFFTNLENHLDDTGWFYSEPKQLTLPMVFL